MKNCKFCLYLQSAGEPSKQTNGDALSSHFVTSQILQILVHIALNFLLWQCIDINQLQLFS